MKFSPYPPFHLLLSSLHAKNQSSTKPIICRWTGQDVIYKSLTSLWLELLKMNPKITEAVWASPQWGVWPPRSDQGSSYSLSGRYVEIVTLPSLPSSAGVSVLNWLLHARHCPGSPSKCLASYCLFSWFFGYCLDVKSELGAENMAGNPSNLCRPCFYPLLLWPVWNISNQKERNFNFLPDPSQY